MGKQLSDRRHRENVVWAPVVVARSPWIRLVGDSQVSGTTEDGRCEQDQHYEYGMFGEVTQTVGTLASDFQYAGYYYHAPSGLNLTTFRAYNPTLGRWINRDPIGEAGCVNLYQYALNRPSTVIDPTGLDVVILYDRSARPTGGPRLGHCSTLVGNDNTGWHLFSNAPTPYTATVPDLATFFSTPISDNWNFGRFNPIDSLQFTTDPDADAAGIAAGNASIGHFNGPTHNCANTCRDILNAAGVPIGSGGFLGTGFLATPAGTFSAASAAGGHTPLFVP